MRLHHASNLSRAASVSSLRAAASLTCATFKSASARRSHLAHIDRSAVSALDSISQLRLSACEAARSRLGGFSDPHRGLRVAVLGGPTSGFFQLPMGIGLDSIFGPGQPVNQPASELNLAMQQREMPWHHVIKAPKWLDAQTVKGWETWRDAVLWCWEHRVNRPVGNEAGDQTAFRMWVRRTYGVSCHAPHVSRWLNADTKAPMDLPVDLAPAFETFTGWRGLTQYKARISGVTIVEHMQALMVAA